MGKVRVPQGQQQQQAAPGYTKLSFLVAAIRSRLHILDNVARQYLEDAGKTVLAGLTVSQRCGIFNLAMSAVGVGLNMPKGSDGKYFWDDTVATRGLALADGATLSPSLWVHSTWAPPHLGGQEEELAVQALWLMGAADGVLTDFAAFTGGDRAEYEKNARAAFVETCKAAVEAKVIRQNPRRGGFSLAVVADLQAAEKDGRTTSSGASRGTLSRDSILKEIQR